MILQALKEYYDRKAPDPANQMAPPSFQWKEIPYVVVLKLDGTPVALESTYEGEGKQRSARRFLVPQAVKRTRAPRANLLWDNPAYALGVAATDRGERTLELHGLFRARLGELAGLADPGIEAVSKFLGSAGVPTRLESFGEDWRQLVEQGANLSFRLAGDDNARLVAGRPAVFAAIQNMLADDGDRHTRICLVSGTEDAVERLHPAIKGVHGAQTSGANIVSFNLDAFCSYGKDQGGNAPVGKAAAFAYTTALNHLLRRDSSQKLQVGDATTVFWAARETPLEQQVPDFFGEPPKDDPDRNARAVASLLRAVESGAFAPEDHENRFYVLGLAPNAARVAVRFWHVDTVVGMSVRIAQHFLDTRLVHGSNHRDHLSLKRLLKSIAAQEDEKHIPPNLAGDTMRAILEGLPYPETLLQAAVRRNRAEQDVPYARAALIRACLNRKTRYTNPNLKEELHVSLDPTNTNTGYRLGRLFAVLEKIQAEASPGINATIRDRYYGAASGTPVTVFSTLMKLKNHHLAKLENAGRRVNFERLIGQVIDGITDFPANLSLADQGRFAIGYYHQMQDFFTKKSE